MRKTVVFVAAAVIGATTLTGSAMAQSTGPAPSTSPARSATAGMVQLNVNTAINQTLVDKYVRDAPNVALAKCEGPSPAFSSPALTFTNYTPGPFMGADANISADAELKPGTAAGTYPLTVTCGGQTYTTQFTVPATQVAKVPSGAAKAGDGSMAG
ncbi:hypothetical protein AMES_0918 [Amycolatopsis mediterranei S699]|uniref:Secreted protein n=2 Tax=Amycolatopsis mediterranei TaxID=33910 RepID=A0A0H3CXH6_AMYMU|nr:hypothetical protein [Amycolatopsis mediterranei]ADJ42740.1 hypothetical protein AMED_0921 [Amycolatopsis mediterranei U32]AEK39431.1 hypothetical protein RAM_04695 [Amycolatopsis mediterranei S699]AFO74454.1 hypothetical protein AMES_0918 [Amycolatopsis mediterranei S699]AGT81583.1 hypothetical protein B737_0919 [Amycolatopsis mediterranei RB]KDO09960.1 hypothetical protein DV26_14875 [Amycolatopsis mediterranei]